MDEPKAKPAVLEKPASTVGMGACDIDRSLHTSVAAEIYKSPHEQFVGLIPEVQQGLLCFCCADRGETCRPCVEPGAVLGFQVGNNILDRRRITKDSQGVTCGGTI